MVDDDPGVLELVSLVLEQEGFQVDTATTGQSALRKARRNSYDLAILDLILPDADGVILQGKLRQMIPDLRARTIFMTGFTSKDLVLDYLRTLSAEFIQKPFEVKQLRRAVQRIR